MFGRAYVKSLGPVSFSLGKFLGVAIYKGDLHS